MNDGNLQLVTKGCETEEPKTVQQMADVLGVSHYTVRRRIEELGIKPVREASHAQGGAIAALYDMAAFCNLQQQQQLQIAKKHETAQRHIAKALDAVGTGIVMEEAIEKLKDDHSAEGVKSKIANAVGFMAMLVEEMKFMDNANSVIREQNEALRLEIEDLQLQLNIHESKCTLEKYNEMHSLGYSSPQLAAISRRLGKAYTREKIVTQEHADGVWVYTIADLDADRANSEGVPAPNYGGWYSYGGGVPK